MAYKVFQNGFPLPASDLNNYLMNQSVITFANSTDRTAALPTPVEGMLTYLESTNSYEGWNGAAWVNVTSQAVPLSTVTTAGDLIVGTGASAVSRLGIGLSGQILSSNGTTAEWTTPSSGGISLLSTTTLSGTSTTITGISQIYKSLYLVTTNVVTSSGANLKIMPNGVNPQYTGVSDGTTFAKLDGDTRKAIGNAAANVESFFWQIFDYSNTSTVFNKMIVANNSGQSTGGQSIMGGGVTTGAVTSIEITRLPYSGTPTFTSGTVRLYGVS